MFSTPRESRPLGFCIVSTTESPGVRACLSSPRSWEEAVDFVDQQHRAYGAAVALCPHPRLRALEQLRHREAPLFIGEVRDGIIVRRGFPSSASPRLHAMNFGAPSSS